jgi:hypothetical protein
MGIERRGDLDVKRIDRVKIYNAGHRERQQRRAVRLDARLHDPVDLVGGQQVEQRRRGHQRSAGGGRAGE